MTRFTIAILCLTAPQLLLAEGSYVEGFSAGYDAGYGEGYDSGFSAGSGQTIQAQDDPFSGTHSWLRKSPDGRELPPLNGADQLPSRLKRQQMIEQFPSNGIIVE